MSNYITVFFYQATVCQRLTTMISGRVKFLALTWHIMESKKKTLLLSENELRATSLGHDFSSCMLINAVVS
jgi:hypothetical protein